MRSAASRSPAAREVQVAEADLVAPDAVDAARADGPGVDDRDRPVRRDVLAVVVAGEDRQRPRDAAVHQRACASHCASPFWWTSTTSGRRGRPSYQRSRSRWAPLDRLLGVGQLGEREDPPRVGRVRAAPLERVVEAGDDAARRRRSSAAPWRAVGAQDAVARQHRHAAARERAHAACRVVVARDRDDAPAEPGDARREQARLGRAAGVAEVADEEHRLVAGVVAAASRARRGCCAGRRPAAPGACRRAGRRSGRSAARRTRRPRPGPCSRTRRPPCARSRRRRGAGRVRRRARSTSGGSRAPLVERRLRALERRAARERRDRDDGDRRADQHAAAALAERGQREAEHERDHRRAADARSAACARRSGAPPCAGRPRWRARGARSPLAARSTTSRSTVRGSRCRRIGARNAWKRTPQSASGMYASTCPCAAGSTRTETRPSSRVVLAGARDAQAEHDTGQRQRDDDDGRQEANGEPAAAEAAPGWRSGVHPS